MGQTVGNAGREEMAEKNSVPGGSSRCTRDGGSYGQTPSLSPTYGQRSRLDTHSTRCVHVCACVWVGVGALVVHLIKSGLITQRTL